MTFLFDRFLNICKTPIKVLKRYGRYVSLRYLLYRQAHILVNSKIYILLLFFQYFFSISPKFPIDKCLQT